MRHGWGKPTQMPGIQSASWMAPFVLGKVLPSQALARVSAPSQCGRLGLARLPTFLSQYFEAPMVGTVLSGAWQGLSTRPGFRRPCEQQTFAPVPHGSPVFPRKSMSRTRTDGRGVDERLRRCLSEFKTQGGALRPRAKGNRSRWLETATPRVMHAVRITKSDER
ncbi:hypothetical protein VTK26DRAFT_8154 [Humicola hyalothermophila]